MSRLKQNNATVRTLTVPVPNLDEEEGDSNDPCITVSLNYYNEQTRYIRR